MKTPPAGRRMAGGVFCYMSLFVEKLISVAIAAPAAKSSSTAPAAPAATSTAAESAAAAATLTRSGFVHGQTATVDFDAVELRYSGIAFRFRGHLDEAESARAPRIAVHHNLRRLDGAGL